MIVFSPVVETWQALGRLRSGACLWTILVLVLLIGCTEERDVETSSGAGLATLDAYESSGSSGLTKIIVACGPDGPSTPAAVIAWDGKAVLRSRVNAYVSWNEAVLSLKSGWWCILPPNSRMARYRIPSEEPYPHLTDTRMR